MEDRPIGHGNITGQLPKWLVENRDLYVLEKDSQTGKLYADHLFYFQCLAWHRGCGLINLERKTQELASTYLATLEHPESFEGVRLRDLHSLACTRWCILGGRWKSRAGPPPNGHSIQTREPGRLSTQLVRWSLQLRQAPDQIQSMLYLPVTSPAT